MLMLLITIYTTNTHIKDNSPQDFYPSAHSINLIILKPLLILL